MSSQALDFSFGNLELLREENFVIQSLYCTRQLQVGSMAIDSINYYRFALNKLVGEKEMT
ncbi:MAG: hypothetical protein HYS18_16970 [Burkholderiales bacterium]|nr:hypothetical protein [Burkholderiales bacterium]